MPGRCCLLFLWSWRRVLPIYSIVRPMFWNVGNYDDFNGMPGCHVRARQEIDTRPKSHQDTLLDILGTAGRHFSGYIWKPGVRAHGHNHAIGNVPSQGSDSRFPQIRCLLPLFRGICCLLEDRCLCKRLGFFQQSCNAPRR